jgi:methyl-accepting chemotaxis protein
MNRLETVRGDAQRILLAGLVIGTVIYLAASVVVAPEKTVFGTAILIAAVGLVFISWRAAPHEATTRMVFGAAMMAFPAALTFMMSGKSWQIDMHMTFFAALAAVTVLCDRKALLAAAGTAAVHHLALNFILPAAVFPGGGDLARVIFHAVVVVIQTGLLIWLSDTISKALTDADQALGDASQARTEAEALAQTDRTKEAATQKSRARVAELASAFEKQVGGVLTALERSASEMAELSGELKADASETRGSAAQVAGRSEETGRNVQAVASAATELAASIQEVTRTLAQADEISGRAESEASRAGESMARLNAAAQEIEQIADLVTSIAAQTNLLALNATIEAARAGEAGKGFAVVASEVKELANQTGNATEEIRSKIDAMRRAAEQAGAGLKQIGGTIGEVRTASTDARGAFSEQAAATDEIARLASDAATATAQVGEEVAKVSGAAARADAAAARFEDAASGLADSAERLSDELAKFRADLGAAA